MNRFIPLLLLIGFLTQCRQNEPVPQVNKSFALSLNDSVSIDLKSPYRGSLGFKLVRVEDGRCPEGANCLIIGLVRISFILSLNGDSDAIDYYFGIDGNRGSKPMDGRTFEVVVEDVQPYPRLDNLNSPRKVVFLVRER